MLNVVEAMKKIETLSEDYMKIVENETQSYKLTNKDRFAILKDWWFALIFFFDRVFYQGRKDKLSKRYELATISCLNSFLGKGRKEKMKKLLSLNERGMLNYKQKNSEINKILKQMSCGKERDIEMTIDILNFVANNLEEYGYNLLEYSIEKIKEHEIRQLFNELDNIRQVGDKTGTLFIRDAVAIYDLTEYLKKSDYVYLQPVDTWVRQLAIKLELCSEGTTDFVIKNRIIDECLSNGISPIEFNQGIWLLGSHSLDVIFKWCFH